jgi:hypothetical protein
MVEETWRVHRAGVQREAKREGEEEEEVRRRRWSVTPLRAGVEKVYKSPDSETTTTRQSVPVRVDNS